MRRGVVQGPSKHRLVTAQTSRNLAQPKRLWPNGHARATHAQCSRGARRNRPLGEGFTTDPLAMATTG